MDFHTWLLDVGYNRIFRMWKYKRMFTPYEQDQKFSDESVFEDDIATHIQIKEAIVLPDKDILIGYHTMGFDDVIMYDKLSEIYLEYC